MFKPKFALLTLAMLFVLASFISSNSITRADSVSSTVAAGDAPVALAVDPVTNKVYVANRDSDTVTVIDGNDNSTTTVAAGDGPFAVAVNAVTNKVYVANRDSDNVTVIDGSDNSTTTLSTGDRPVAVAVNPATNKVYVANSNSDNVTVIDGSSNSSATVAAGDFPHAVAVNPVTNMVYVANFNSANLTAIDGGNNSTTTVAVGDFPQTVAVNPVTNKVYVANNAGNTVTVIDGSNNSTAIVAAGTKPSAVAVNPVTNKVYVGNSLGANVTVITPSLIQSSPLTTAITPLTDNTTTTAITNFSFSATSAYTPTAPPVQQIYYQVDTQTGPWLRATPDGTSGSGDTPPLQQGIHLLFAFATDGQEATSINTGTGSSPIPGQVSAYQFLTQLGGTINIVKDTVPDAAQDFSFTDNIAAPNTFSLDDDANGTLSNTQTFTSVAAGMFTVTEAAVAGYTTTVACVDPDGGSTGGTNVATIDLDAGETVTCTFTNTLIVVGGTTLLEDNFNRPDDDDDGVPQVGGPWVELETPPEKASVKISNNRLFFDDTSDVDFNPLVKSSFTPASTGNITWTFDFDWTRTGSEGTYNLLMQLGNGPTMTDVSLDAGVGINLIWANIGGVHQTLGYRDGSGNHPLQVLSGSAPIKVLANLNANTFTVQVGAGTVHGPFAFHNPVTLSQARYFTHKLNEKNFAGRSFDDVFVATN